MAKPISKKESYGLTLRKDAKYYCKHASMTWAKEGKRIMTRARRHDKNWDGKI